MLVQLMRPLGNAINKSFLQAGQGVDEFYSISGYSFSGKMLIG
jgi:hypothetical protein